MMTCIGRGSIEGLLGGGGGWKGCGGGTCRVEGWRCGGGGRVEVVEGRRRQGTIKLSCVDDHFKHIHVN